MQRSRLKNIINKSKEFSKVGNPFEDFKSTLPKELQIGENYRLKAAWKAYGSPRNFKEALWEGMILPIDENTFKLPSIGYNEETEEYEYLNKGKENDIVAKDIRVWDNDVIPFVKELKYGGYIRIYNEEKDCWTYSKNSQPKTEELGSEINSFKKGGKSKRSETVLMLYANNSGVPFIKRILSKDTRSIQIPGEKYPSTHLLSYGESDGKTYVFPQVMEDNEGNLKWYGDKAFDRALETKDYLEMTPEEAEWFTTHYKEYYPEYFGKFENGGELEAFKQGGQMSVIPEGALHARKNNMELAKEGEVTNKGIPVVNKEGEQLAEIEKNEIIFSKAITDKIEELYKKYNDEESNSKKDEIAIEMGKIITCEIVGNTDDRTGLIEEVKESM